LNKIFFRKVTIILVLISFLSLEGCEAFRKKFIRKKKVEQVEENVILVPQEYPEVVYDNVTLYKKYYSFWKASQSELLESLKEGQSYKKQVQCFNEVLKNLSEMKGLLLEQKQQELDAYIQEISINKDKFFNAKLKNNILSQLRSKLESIEKKIRINFVFKKVKDWIKK